MHTLPGNPAALSHRASDLSRSARAIQEAAEALFGLSFAGSSEALTVVAQHADQLAGKVKKAHSRYEGTAQALHTYAIDLHAAHVRANDAISDDASSARYVDSAEYTLATLLETRRTVEEADPHDSRLHTIDDDMREQAAIRDRYDRARHEAAQQWARAKADLDSAAEEAITKIDAAIASTNDGFWDHVANFIEGIGEILEAVAAWVTDVLATIIKAMVAAIVTVALLALGPLIILSMIAWIVIVFPLLVGIGGLLLLTFLLPGLEQWRTQLLALLFFVALPMFGAFIIGRIASDLFAPDPKVTALDDGDLPPGQSLDAKHAAEDMPGMYSLGDYMEAEGLTDTMGGEDRSVVDIRKVIGPDGVERWVINLPSTQDWLFAHGDTGATNDLDANLALMLTPSQRTQYERAVLDAMHQANIGPNDPVMLVGFSQGGIMAGHLAANRSSEFNFAAVLAYGAPIDAMNIPDTTRVLSIQHTGDVVPMLDLTAPKPNTANHVTVQVDAYDGTIGVTSHGNDKYHDTAAYSPELQQYQHYFDAFSGTVVEEKQYTWHE